MKIHALTLLTVLSSRALAAGPAMQALLRDAGVDSPPVIKTQAPGARQTPPAPDFRQMTLEEARPLLEHLLTVESIVADPAARPSSVQAGSVAAAPEIHHFHGKTALIPDKSGVMRPPTPDEQAMLDALMPPQLFTVIVVISARDEQGKPFLLVNEVQVQARKLARARLDYNADGTLSKTLKLYDGEFYGGAAGEHLKATIRGHLAGQKVHGQDI
jgi:hypothetical protein